MPLSLLKRLRRPSSGTTNRAASEAGSHGPRCSGCGCARAKGDVVWMESTLLAPLAPGVTDDGAKVAVKPLGRPVAVSWIALSKSPPIPVVLTVNWATAPGATVFSGGVTVRVKSVAGGALPVPLRVAVWGELAALSATEIDAVKLPAVAGVKVAEIVQVEPAASDVPQAVSEVVMAKSAALAPVSVMPVMFSTALPVLESVVDIAVAVDPAVVAGKVSVVGERLATGTGAAVPVPLRVAVCGLPVASSATEMEAV